jgi:hypothetical protein
MRRYRLGDNYLYLTRSDNYQNFYPPIDILSPFVYYALEVLAGRGTAKPVGQKQVQGNWPDVKIKQSEHRAVKSCANTPPQTLSLQELQNKHLAIST